VKFFEKACLKAADEIVVLSERHKEYLAGLPYLEAKRQKGAISVIPCCVDLDRFKYGFTSAGPLRKKEGMENDFVFLYPGKLRTHYMAGEMMDFFKIALEKMPNSRFVILTQEDAQRVKQLALDKGVDNARVIIKKPTSSEIPDLLSLAHAGIFFISPYKKFGSSPIKLGEFLSCGVPVIINSGIGDTEELVVANRVGVVVKEFDAASYKMALEEFLQLLAEGESLNARCRKTAERFLSLDMGVERYNRIYSRLNHV